MTKTDYELLHGDSDDFAELHTKYTCMIKSLLHKYKRVRRVTDIDDILQLIWIRVHIKRDKYDPRWKLSTWLTRLALSVVMNFYRNQDVLIFTTNQHNLESYIDPLEERDSLVVAETCARVREAVDDLPENAKKAIEVVYFSSTRFATANYHQGYKRGRRILRKSLKDMQDVRTA